MKLSIEFEKDIHEGLGIYSIAFGEKFYITRSGKIKEWAQKIVDDIGEAISKPGNANHPSSKAVAHLIETGIKTAHVTLLEAIPLDGDVMSRMNFWLQNNENNPLCLNKRFTTRWGGADIPATEKKPWVPYKLIHQNIRNKRNNK